MVLTYLKWGSQDRNPHIDSKVWTCNTHVHKARVIDLLEQLMMQQLALSLCLGQCSVHVVLHQRFTDPLTNACCKQNTGRDAPRHHHLPVNPACYNIHRSLLPHNLMEDFIMSPQRLTRNQCIKPCHSA